MQIIKGSQLLDLGRLFAKLEMVAAGYADLSEPCDDCGAPLGEHLIGGPNCGCPRPPKPALWFWGVDEQKAQTK